MTTNDQMTALRKAVAGVKTARPGVARQHMSNAMLAKATLLQGERERLDRYLEKGTDWLGKHDLATEPPRNHLRSELVRSVLDEQFADDDRYTRYRAALALHHEIAMVLQEAEAVIGSRKAA